MVQLTEEKAMNYGGDQGRDDDAPKVDLDEVIEHIEGVVETIREGQLPSERELEVLRDDAHDLRESAHDTEKPDANEGGNA